MNSRRTVILIVAIVVGLIASFGLLNYIQNVEGSVYDNAEPEKVWVVRQTIAKGTSIDEVLTQQMIVESEIPAKYRPATAVVDPETELANLVAIAELPANATLVSGNFVTPDVVNTGITDRLEEKELTTLTFSVDQVKGAAYLIEPGDYVNVLMVKQLVEDAEVGGTNGDDGAVAASVPAATSQNTSFDYLTRYVYQKAEVLAVDKALTPELGESNEETAAAPRNGGMITLAVPPEAIPVVLSVGLENLYLSLVPDTYVPVPMAPLGFGGAVLPGEDAEQLTPYGPNGLTEDADQQ